MKSEMRRNHLLIIFLSYFIFTINAQVPSKQADLKPGKNEIMITMHDGAALATDVYLPKKKGRLPVVLVRTPYNKSSEEWMGNAFSRFGIAVNIVHYEYR